MRGVVVAVSRSATHTLRKLNVASIRLVAGLGVEGDAHLGKSVQYRSRVARDPSWSAQSVHSARAHSGRV
jgi:hypothetical protein